MVFAQALDVSQLLLKIVIAHFIKFIKLLVYQFVELSLVYC